MGFFEKLKGGIKSAITFHKATDVGLVGSTLRHPKTTAAIIGASAITAISPVATLGFARQLLPQTAKGKLLGALALPSVIQVLGKSKKTREKVAEAGSFIVTGQPGIEVTEIIESETPIQTGIEKALEFAKEYPVLTTLTGVAGVGLIGSKLPFGAGLIAANLLGDKRDSPPQKFADDGFPKDSRRESPSKPVSDKEPVTTPKVAPSAGVETPPTSTPVAIPAETKVKRATTRKRRKKRCPKSHFTGKMCLKFGG